MDVDAAFERVDQAGVLGEVREHPELDLRVVGGEQAPPVLGDERAPELASVGRADRDVLEVRRLARDPAGRRVGLLEGRVHTPVGRDQRRECIGVRAAQLLDLAVAQQVVDDRVVVPHLLERVGIGGRARLRLLHRDETELLEEHDSQLRRRVHVELLAGVLPDRAHRAGRTPH